MHQPTDMIAMVTDAELAPDDFRDASRRPQLRPVAVRRSALEQQLHQAVPLSRVQLQWPSGREAHSQAIGASTTARPLPPHYGTRRAMDTTPNFVQGQACVQQGQGSSATIFKQVGTALQSGHQRSLLKDIVLHYLCRCQ